MAQVTLTNVSKNYGDTEVLHDINLAINAGEFVVFVGPSGCGKSTLLRMIAGLEEITGGELSIEGKTMNEVAAAKRGVAMVFQSYALYPHMTVFNNMAFGLKLAKIDKEEIDRRVREAADILQLKEYLERQPKALSGGQRQRVAIGRAIVRDPKVFLFDEPLSNLDAALRAQTRLEIAKMHNRLTATMIYVTHDQVEAMTLADRIVVMNAGNIEQVGTPIELYNTPGNEFVAGFIGSPKMNLLPVSAVALDEPQRTKAHKVGIRPEHLIPVEGDNAPLTGTIEVMENLGEHILTHCVGDDGIQFTVKLADTTAATKGAKLAFAPASGRTHWFDNAGQRI